MGHDDDESKMLGFFFLFWLSEKDKTLVVEKSMRLLSMTQEKFSSFESTCMFYVDKRDKRELCIRAKKEEINLNCIFDFAIIV